MELSANWEQATPKKYKKNKMYKYKVLEPIQSPDISCRPLDENFWYDDKDDNIDNN